jgi:dTDP-4-dehydrorhamnose reductase
MSAKRVLIIGGSGMLGHKLLQVLPGKGYDVFATVRGSTAPLESLESVRADRLFGGVDALDFATVESAVREVAPDAIVNAAGIVKQREEGNDPALVIEVNSVFPHRLSSLAERMGCRLVTVSTDCVFTGRKGNYREDDHPDADDLYGRSKCLGEVADGNAVTVRTSMIGREIGEPHGLLEWFLRNPEKEVLGYTKAFFSGFPTITLAGIISDYLIPDSRLNGIWHVSADRISKYDLLVIIKQKYGLEVNVVPDEQLSIDRSLDSGRFRKLTGFEPFGWERLVEVMRDDPTPYHLWKT